MVTQQERRTYDRMRRAGYTADHAWYVVKGDRLARQYGLIAVWEDDPEMCIGCDCGSDKCACASGKPHQIEMVHVEDEDGHTVGGYLGGVCEADQAYRDFLGAEQIHDAVHYICKDQQDRADREHASIALIPAFSV